jgi:hypothetical protein
LAYTKRGTAADTHHRGKTPGTLAKDGSGLLAKTGFSTDFLD